MIDEIRKKLNMDNPEDVAMWDELMEIQRTPEKALLKGFFSDMQADLDELEAQIATMDKLRVRHLFSNNNLSQQADDALKILRKDRDELKQTLQSKAYQGLDGRPGSGTVETRG